jgi:hypothetical protein
MKTRIKKINELMKFISEEERAFFANKSGNNLIANFQLIDTVLHYQDEYEGICCPINSKILPGDLNEWISHGMDIRCQILEFTKFIETGKPQGLLSRYWGISFESQFKIFKKCKEIGFIDQDELSFYDYTLSKDIFLCQICKQQKAVWISEEKIHFCEDCSR